MTELELKVEIEEFDYIVEGQTLHEDAEKLFVRQKPPQSGLYLDGAVNAGGLAQAWGFVGCCKSCGRPDVISRGAPLPYCGNCADEPYSQDRYQGLQNLITTLEEMYIDEEDRIKESPSDYDEYSMWQ